MSSTKKLYLIGPLIFVLLNIASLFWITSSVPKVMILHSYSTNYSWTNIVDIFLKEELKDRQYLRYNFYYMKSKKQYNNRIEKTTVRAIQNYNPDVIISFDDNAQKLLAKNRAQLSDDLKIVFAGVNGFVDKYNYPNDRNVTGVFERKPLAGVLFVISSLNKQKQTPGHKNIVMLVDGSNSSKIDIDFLQKGDWQDFNFSPHTVETFNQWKAFVSSLDKSNAHYLLVSGYRKLILDYKSNGEPLYTDYKDVVQWTQKHSAIPIIAMNTFSAKDGFALAVGSSPAEQVTKALSLMDKILLDKLVPSDIPYQDPSHYSIAINEKAVEETGYQIPLFIISFAEASNSIF